MLELDPATGYLPPGTHVARVEEVQGVFGTGPRRRMLMENLRTVIGRLQAKGVTEIWLDGSFVTNKVRPGDVDVVYVPPAGADTATWGLLAFDRRRELKAALHVDLWPHPSMQPGRSGRAMDPLIDWFRFDRNDVAKGVVQLVLPADKDQP